MNREAAIAPPRLRRWSFGRAVIHDDDVAHRRFAVQTGKTELLGRDRSRLFSLLEIRGRKCKSGGAISQNSNSEGSPPASIRCAISGEGKARVWGASRVLRDARAETA